MKALRPRIAMLLKVLRWTSVGVLLTLLVLDLTFPPPLPRAGDTSTLVVARDGTPCVRLPIAMACGAIRSRAKASRRCTCRRC